MDVRIEKDSIGEMEIPSDALYGIQTRRAQLNFPISGWRMPPEFIHVLALIKKCAAIINSDLGLLDTRIAELIVQAASEVADGKHDDQFIVDVFQTGSGTSTNMNANEVIANRANQLAGGQLGAKSPVHPNDHVNLGQSSNDVIPTALHIAASIAITHDLLPALAKLQESLGLKSREFREIIKIGRTHLQDATPITLGQVFSGYTAQVANSRARLEQALLSLSELPIGGTAVGTGLNTHPDFGKLMAHKLSEETGLEFQEAGNHFEAQAVRDAVIETSSTIKTVAISLAKIANDVRLLASGPRCGIGEITIPATQPGSSIMPGKVNPVIPESLMQVAAYAVGADACITHAAATLSNFELSVSMPVMTYQLLETIRLLSNVTRIFAEKCIDEIQANRERCSELVEQSHAMVTALVPEIGYDKAAEIANIAYKTGRTIREVASDLSILAPDKLDELLDPKRMTGQG